ncbi:hypothetical protein [Chimaeribacter arupi]|nr:hypothetical protein [Chimaeribacter arupi]
MSGKNRRDFIFSARSPGPAAPLGNDFYAAANLQLFGYVRKKQGVYPAAISWFFSEMNKIPSGEDLTHNKVAGG